MGVGDLEGCGSKYAKGLFVASAKEGKTVFLVAQALGVFPGQKFGGIVDAPENLHLISIDSGAVAGVKPFLHACGLEDDEIKRVTVHQLTDEARRANISQTDWDYSFYNKLVETARRIEKAARGCPAVIVSSVTSLSQTLERQLAGPSDEARRGSGMDQSKWSELARQVAEIRNLLQQDRWHCIWEGHTYRPPATGQGQSQDAKAETIQMSGKSGYNFPNNVEQIIRLRRLYGDTHDGTRIDKVYMDTRPALDFLSGGRGFTENLDAKEWDMTLAFAKLGLQVGKWKRSSKSSKSGKSSK